MGKKFLKRLTPDPETLRGHKSLQLLGDWLHDPNIWHLNRRSVSSAVFIGLFVAFIPLPTQMLLAALAAILMRANLPVSVMVVWVSNPVTMPPLFYFAYRVGFALIGEPQSSHFDFEPTWDWVATELAESWQPFLLGCLVCGLSVGLIGKATVRLLWRRHAISRWQARRRQRQQKSSQHSDDQHKNRD